MKVAFILYDGMTMLDFVGFFDSVTRLKTMGFKEDLEWDICGLKENASDDRGLSMAVNKIAPDLSTYDLLFIPGGFGSRELMNDVNFIDWLKSGQHVSYKVSVCTGSLLLGAAGFLQGKKATTHHNGYAYLKPYCAEVVTDRIVRDGNIITGGGVSTSIDLGLYICEHFAGAKARQTIQKQMDYPYFQGK